ncbi:hypothetical protein HanRHA438_Chr03g0116051 [Helianthus annuus]|nr:hypothetical protein HanRHA438_Chr03g0116051 [Helianthus annuus]
MLRWQIKFWRVQDCFGVFGSWSKLGQHKEQDQSNTGRLSQSGSTGSDQSSSVIRWSVLCSGVYQHFG